MREMNFDIPYPPSTNKVWRTSTVNGVRRTYLTEHVCIYRHKVYEAVRQQFKHMKDNAQITEPLYIQIYAYPPDKRTRDLDNILKCTFDALTYAGVWLDDGLVDALSVHRCDVCKGGKLSITIHVLDKKTANASRVGKTRKTKTKEVKHAA